MTGGGACRAARCRCRQFIDAIYALRPIELARFAPLVIAHRGDPVAGASSPRPSATSLSDFATAFDPAMPGPSRWAAASSRICRASPPAIAEIVRAAGLVPDIRPVTDGSVGAIVLAMRTIGDRVDEAMFQTITASVRRRKAPERPALAKLRHLERMHAQIERSRQRVAPEILPDLIGRWRAPERGLEPAATQPAPKGRRAASRPRGSLQLPAHQQTLDLIELPSIGRDHGARQDDPLVVADVRRQRVDESLELAGLPVRHQVRGDFDRQLGWRVADCQALRIASERASGSAVSSACSR